MWLGGRVHLGLIDLAIAVEPRLAVAASGTRDATEPGRRPWVGLIVVALLLAGTLLSGEAGLWIVREAVPHRETTP